MSVIRDVHLTLAREQVLLRLERGWLRPVPKIRDLVGELLETVPDMLEPSFVYAVRPANRHNAEASLTALSEKDAGVSVPVGLRSATQLVLVIGTIGPRLEKKAAEYFAQKEPMRAIVLDRIGNVAVGLLQQRAYEYLKGKIVPPGNEVTNLLKPGGQCWPISAQRRIFQLVSPEQIGVSLTSGAVMFPCKSVSMAIGIGTRMVIQTPNELCARCNMGRGCTFKARAVEIRSGDTAEVL